MSEQTSWRIRAPRAADESRWRALYRAYADFYASTQNDEQAGLVWSWIQHSDYGVGALVAEDRDGIVQGLAHYRPFARPLAATVGCYLDDLFVDPASRGRGAANALLRGLSELSQARGWDIVRWITADDNYAARSLYDLGASRTTWITYETTSWPAKATAPSG